MLDTLRSDEPTHPGRLRVALVLLALVPLTLFVACGGSESPATGTEGEPAAETADTDDAIAPVRAQGNGAAPAATGAPGPVSFELPEGWQERSATGAMRSAEAVIPGEAGDAEMIVFYFGPGQGGGVEPNLQRWIGQMQTAEGTEPERGNFQVGDLTVTHITVHGTLLPSGMGTGPSEPQPDSTLMGAVVEGPGGPWFFKVTGPQATLEDEQEAFLEMLHTVQPPA